MTSNLIKTEIKVDDQVQKSAVEFKVIIPPNHDKKRYSVLQFNGPMNIDPGNWPQTKLAMTREDNRAHTVGPSEIIQQYGEGSEYGRAAREEARRKKYGRQTRKYNHDNQPWKLVIKNKTPDAKEKHYRSVREGGAGAHSDYWVFMKIGSNFHAHKIEDWYRFMPDPKHRGLDIDQVEEEFLQRNKVLNQFALKAKIQQTLKDQDEDGGNISKPFSLKIKDEASSEDEDADDESRRDNEKSSKKKKNGPARDRKDKKQRVKNADEVAAYESEDGEDEGREYDYISDSGSDTSREEITVDEKVEKALVAVGDESALREDASDEESDEDSELDDEDEVGKKKRQLLKKLNESASGIKSENQPEVRLVDKVDKRDSSGSDTDDPDNETRGSVLFLQAKALKRPADSNSGEPTKRPKVDSREQTPSSSSQPIESDVLNEEMIRRMLQQRPMSTKELLNKIKPKFQSMSKEAIVARLADILKVLNPVQTHRTINKKQVLYFSLNRNS